MQTLINKVRALKLKTTQPLNQCFTARQGSLFLVAAVRSPTSPNAVRWFSKRAPMRQQLQLDFPNSLRRSKVHGGQGKVSPARTSRSESENNSGRWLRCVGPTVGVEGPDPKIGVFVDIAPVLGAQREVSGQCVIDACAIQERTFCLSISAGQEAARVGCWMKYQTATTAQNVRIKPGYPERKTYNQVGCGRVHIRLNSREPTRRKIPLGVAVIAIVRFAGKPAIEVITVPNEKSARLCGCPRDSLAVSVLREKTCALNTDLRAIFLSRGAKT